MKEIGERLFLSIYGVKYHRGNILNKLGAKNIGEAMACAANYKLL
jgi:DNA-binding CsgD family transcriptional regulator